MPSLVAVADRSHVDPDDALVVLVDLVGDGAELDLDDLSAPGYVDLAADLLAVLGAVERDVAHPRWSPASDLAQEYRATGDETLLDELRNRGHGRYAGFLAFERPRPGDLPTHAVTREQMRGYVDEWIAAAPEDRTNHGRIRYVLGG